MMNWKVLGRKRSWPNLKVLSRHSPGRTEISHENLSQDSRSPGLDSNPGSPEYEAGVLTTRPRRSVIWSVSLHFDDMTCRGELAKEAIYPLRNSSWCGVLCSVNRFPEANGQIYNKITELSLNIYNVSAVDRDSVHKAGIIMCFATTSEQLVCNIACHWAQGSRV
jgi:hypothetical protein